MEFHVANVSCTCTVAEVNTVATCGVYILCIYSYMQRNNQHNAYNYILWKKPHNNNYYSNLHTSAQISCMHKYGEGCLN